MRSTASFESTLYAFPGSEEVKRPSEFIPVAPPEIVATLPEGKCEVVYGVADGESANALVQLRGEPLRPGDEVPRRWLEVLGGDALPTVEAGSGRRELADWIASPSNPLTARVMVNRVWQHHFGTGLVSTPNDFGARAPPSHPELLDWLATRFIESGWSIKELHRLIMNSSAYRMSAGRSPLTLRD